MSYDAVRQLPVGAAGPAMRVAPTIEILGT
jgi:hypothetical protein